MTRCLPVLALLWFCGTAIGQSDSQADAWVRIKSSLDAGVKLAERKKLAQARDQFAPLARHWQHHHLTSLYLSVLEDVDKNRLENKYAHNLFKAQDQGNRDQAKKGLKTADKVIKKNKEYVPAHLIRAGLLAQMQKDAEAQAAYAEAIRLSPGRAMPLVFRAKYFEARDQPDLALADLTAATGRGDGYDLSYFERGYLNCLRGDFDAAIADFEILAARQPDWAATAIVLEAYFKRGLQHLQRQDFHAALADFDRAIAIDPAYLKSYLSRGLVHFNLKSYGKALADFSHCIEQDGSLSEAYYQRAQIFNKRRQYDKAAADLKSALDLNPDDVKLRYTLGEAYYYAGEYDRAIAAFAEVIRQDPGYYWAYYQMGHASKMRGRRTEAVRAFERFVSLAPPQYRRQIQSARMEIKRLKR